MATQITIIGAGNMGASLLGGLIKNGFNPKDLWITDPDQEKLKHLQEKFKVNISQSNEQAVNNAGIIILAVKPQVMATVAANLSKDIKTALVISIAAGISLESLENWLGHHTAIVRCMPNTPALISCGVTGMFANKNVSLDQKNVAEKILNAVGITVWLNEEKLMNAVTAVSGSGPAYFFLIIEAMIEAAQELGLDKTTAEILTKQTAYGACRMALENKENVTTLRKNVTSPGGTTEAALKVLEENNIKKIFLQALARATKRGEELGTQG